MKPEMMWTASVLALLFLPPENGYPLTFPKHVPHYYALLADVDVDLWPRNPATQVLLEDGGLREVLVSGQRRPAPCKPPSPDNENEVQRGRREERPPYASKRQDGKPNSLDLTFHLLREFLEMSRAEKLAQKVFNNKVLLESIGK